MNNNKYGASLVCLMAGLSGASNAFIHATASIYPIMQIVFLKSLVALVLFHLINKLVIRKTGFIRSKIYVWQILRGLFAFAGVIVFTLALRYLTIAEVVIFSASSAIFTSIGARIFFREQVSSTRWLAIVIVILGVLLSKNYYFYKIDVYLILPTLSAILFSASSLCIKKICKHDSTFTTLHYLLVCLSLFSLVPALMTWQTFSYVDFLMLFLAGACYILLQLALIEAYTYAEASYIAPFKFIKYPINIIVGIIFFAQWPTLHTLLGGLVIFSTLLILWLSNKRYNYL